MAPSSSKCKKLSAGGSWRCNLPALIGETLCEKHHTSENSRRRAKLEGKIENPENSGGRKRKHGEYAKDSVFQANGARRGSRRKRIRPEGSENDGENDEVSINQKGWPGGPKIEAKIRFIGTKDDLVETEKRGRGRPKGSTNKKKTEARAVETAARFVKIERIEKQDSIFEVVRGRGRPKGSTNKKANVEIIEVSEDTEEIGFEKDDACTFGAEVNERNYKRCDGKKKMGKSNVRFAMKDGIEVVGERLERKADNGKLKKDFMEVLDEYNEDNINRRKGRSKTKYLNESPRGFACMEEEEVRNGSVKRTTFLASGLLDSTIQRELRGFTCHQCSKSNKNSVIICSNCKRKCYCFECITKWYPHRMNEEVEKLCPFCCGNCNCEACLQADVVLPGCCQKEADGNIKLQRSLYLLFNVLPLLKLIQFEQKLELDFEFRMRGVLMKEEDIPVSEDDQIYCDNCKTSIVNFHRSCDGCSYDRILVPNYIEELISTAERFTRNYRLPDKDFSQKCTVCVDNEFCEARKAANRRNNRDNFLYCPNALDLQAGALEHFQMHWRKGEPVIVRDSLSKGSGLSWEPMVMLRAFRNARKELNEETFFVDAIDCLDWWEVNILTHTAEVKTPSWQKKVIQKLRSDVKEKGPDQQMAKDKEKGESFLSENAYGAAVWDIFRRKDAPKITEYLLKHREEFRHHNNSRVGNNVVHPIHDQVFYLDEKHKKQLKEEFDVEAWTFEQHLGEAVFIPAGCPHQLRNRMSCTKVAVDFVSPDNVQECFRLTNEFRKLQDSHRSKQDILEVKKLVVYAARAAINEARNSMFKLK
ncbi:transcription factor jumonji (jmjC)domain-containing protein [Striga asiatica]|uniref:Transcription factor jumonji (JmjC)domain-containing protein n=1 Tax=Striga asiatica TaxID=4170 RepID=A0A5A7PNF6_STRAF|nr:transcription factor jumonji (jmjC)domain-containing protein [Striga asiatica]